MKKIYLSVATVFFFAFMSMPSAQAEDDKEFIVDQFKEMLTSVQESCKAINKGFLRAKDIRDATSWAFTDYSKKMLQVGSRFGHKDTLYLMELQRDLLRIEDLLPEIEKSLSECKSIQEELSDYIDYLVFHFSVFELKSYKEKQAYFESQISSYRNRYRDAYNRLPRF